MKLNGTHQLPVYANDVNISGESEHTEKEKAEALIMVSKDTSKKEMLKESGNRPGVSQRAPGSLGSQIS